MDRKPTTTPPALVLGQALALASTLALAACQATDNPGEGPKDDQNPSAFQVRQINKKTADSVLKDSDPYRLDSASIEGDSLIVHVTFGGGCEEHVFTLYSSEYTYLSLPGGRDLWLHHEGNDDHCKARLYRRLAFSLGAIGGTEPGGFLQIQRHPSDSGQPLRVRLPVAPPGYPLRFIGLDSAAKLAADSDPLEVTGYQLDGDSLRIQVRYGGGCRDHILTPFVTPMVTETFPPQYNVWIHHDADGDVCKAYVHRNLALDVGELMLEAPHVPRFHVLPLSDLR